MIKDLIKVANSLDSKGFTKEADELDLIIRKLAQMGGAVKVNYSVLPGDTMYEITEKHSKPVGKTVEDNMALNPGLNPQALKVGSVITIWADSAYEGGVMNP
jgi:LysM repeat protein